MESVHEQVVVVVDDDVVEGLVVDVSIVFLVLWLWILKFSPLCQIEGIFLEINNADESGDPRSGCVFLPGVDL